MFDEELTIELRTNEDNTISYSWDGTWGSMSSASYITVSDTDINNNSVLRFVDGSVQWSTIAAPNNLETLQNQIDELSKKVEMLQYQSELVEEDKGTKVESLPGGQGLGELADLEYFQQKLLRSLTKIGS